MEDFVKEIEERTRRNFKINDCPVTTLAEFDDLCRKEFRGNYAIGLGYLLKINRMYEEIIPLLSSILTQINALTEKISKMETNERRVTTFDGYKISD